MKHMKYLVLAAIICPYLAFGQCVKGDCITGHGTYLYPSGAKYTGAFDNGMIDGFGSLQFSNGDKYVGFWKKQYREGKGTLVFANGEKYEGEFVKSQFEGYGKFTFTNGSKYFGDWKNGKMHGKGSMVLESGKKVTGAWKEDVFEDPDQLIEKEEVIVENTNSDDLYEEIVLNIEKEETPSKEKVKLRNCNKQDCIDGQGEYTYQDGSKYIGEFKNGQPHGKGTCLYANGDRYEGGWSDHAPHGEGNMYFRSGRVVGAMWRGGRVIKYLSADENLVVKSEKKKDVDDKVKIWAAVIGVAAYNHMPTLKYTDDDAYRMYAFLKSPEGGALPDKQIRLLIDEDATKNKIIQSMNDLFVQADENDVIMLYMSGHGLKGSFLPYDFDGFHNVLKYEDVQTLLDKSAAKQKICLADACYAGTLTAARSSSLNQSLNKFYDLIDQSDAGTAFLMSSKDEEVSLEDQGLRQGIFSHFLIKGLKGAADRDKDKVIRVGELFDFVTVRVKKYTLNRQSPTIAGKFDANLPIAFIR